MINEAKMIPLFMRFEKQDSLKDLDMVKFEMCEREDFHQLIHAEN